MKLNFLKFKKESLPDLKLLHPRIFDVNKFWFLALALFFGLVLIFGLVGFRLFYDQYFESFKELKPVNNFDDLININRINKAIEKRNEFVNKQISLPQDPSL